MLSRDRRSWSLMVAMSMPIHRDAPRGWLDKPEQRQGQAALASARAANNAKLLASLDGDRDVLASVVVVSSEQRMGAATAQGHSP